MKNIARLVVISLYLLAAPQAAYAGCWRPLTAEEKAVASQQHQRTSLQIAVGAGVAILAGLSKMFLDLTNSKTKRTRPSQLASNPESMTLETLHKLTDAGGQSDWVYHPPSSAKQ
jgi:hypothetical protein